MFIGDLEAEIQAIVWRSWKMCWSSPVYFPHCAFRATALQCAYQWGNWTKWFLDDFRKWSVSRLLDHLWTSNKVYLEASTFVSTNMKKNIEFILKFFKNTIFWMYIYFATVHTSILLKNMQTARFAIVFPTVCALRNATISDHSTMSEQN